MGYMAARQKNRLEESDDEQLQQERLRTKTPISRKSQAQPLKAKVRDHFTQKEIKIEPIYPNIADSPGQINISQLSRHDRIVKQAAALALAQEAEAHKSARRFAPMPELSGHVVYSKKEKEEKIKDVRPAQVDVPESHTAYLKDGLMSESELTRQAALAEVNTQVLLPALQVLPQTRSKPARLAAIARIRQMLLAWVRRVTALLSQLRGPMLTRTGKQAMAQLQRLYALVAAGVSDDDMEMVQLRVAFGEAYYHMMEASRRHHKRHKGREREDYGAYFDQFLRSAPE